MNVPNKNYISRFKFQIGTGRGLDIKDVLSKTIFHSRYFSNRMLTAESKSKKCWGIYSNLLDLGGKSRQFNLQIRLFINIFGK
jgi:hypothetical protein